MLCWLLNFQSFAVFKLHINVFHRFDCWKLKKLHIFHPELYLILIFGMRRQIFCLHKMLSYLHFYFLARDLGEATLTSFIDEIFEFACFRKIIFSMMVTDYRRSKCINLFWFFPIYIPVDLNHRSFQRDCLTRWIYLALASLRLYLDMLAVCGLGLGPLLFLSPPRRRL